MKFLVLLIVSCTLVMVTCMGPPHPNSYSNRRQFPPPKYYYGHKSGYNSGPPPNKYRPPGLRPVRNPSPGPLPYQGIPQGLPYPPGSPYQSGPPHPHKLPGYQSIPPKRFTPAPLQYTKSSTLASYSNPAPWKSQPSHLNSIKDYSPAPTFNAVESVYNPVQHIRLDEDRSPIHTIPAPNLSAADKPVDFDYQIRQSTAAQYQITPGFKSLDKGVSNQLGFNPNAYLFNPLKTHFAPDPDPNNNPIKIPPTNDPHSTPSNGKLPLDIYLQQQLDNEIAQQESILQQQRAMEAHQYQKQIEANLVLQAQQQAQQHALQAQQSQLNQQLLQQQTLQAQQQLSLEAQHQLALHQQAGVHQIQYQQIQGSDTLTAEELYSLMHGVAPNNQARNQPAPPTGQNVLLSTQAQNDVISATTNFQPNFQSFNYDEKAHQEQLQEQILQQQSQYVSQDQQATTNKQNEGQQYGDKIQFNEKTKREGVSTDKVSNDFNEVGQQSLDQINQIEKHSTRGDQDMKKEKKFQKQNFQQNQGYTVPYSTLPKEITDNSYQNLNGNAQQQASYSTVPVPNEKQIKKVKTSFSVSNENKKTNPNYLKKKINKEQQYNGYSTIAEDLVQQNDLQNELKHLTYSTLPNKKIIEVLKQKRINGSQHHYQEQQQDQQQYYNQQGHHQQQQNNNQDQQQYHYEKENNLQRMRENAMKFYNPHIIQAVQNSTNNDNVQIQQSIRIYETSYPSSSNDNRIDLSGMSSYSPQQVLNTVSSTTVSSTSEPSTITEVNIIEKTPESADSDNQESSIFEEIMLQDESKPVEDHYNINSHSYFGQRIRPKRT